MTEIGQHPERLDLTVHPGDPISIGVPVLGADGLAESLSGWTAGARALDANGTVLWDFAPAIVSDEIRVVATSAQTAGWAWQSYAARLIVTATPPAGGPLPIALGWIRLYR